MKLYIAGPMTGLPELNYPAFHEAEAQLFKAGYTPLNPAPNKPENPTWLNFMRMSLVQISQADGIALLPGWELSKGARIEHGLARDLQLPVDTVEQWLREDMRLMYQQITNHI